MTNTKEKLLFDEIKNYRLKTRRELAKKLDNEIEFDFTGTYHDDEDRLTEIGLLTKSIIKILRWRW